MIKKTHINSYLSAKYLLKSISKMNKKQIKTTGCVITFDFLNIEKKNFHFYSNKSSSFKNYIFQFLK